MSSVFSISIFLIALTALGAEPARVNTTEEAIHKIDFLVNRGKIPETYSSHLSEMNIETIGEYKARVAEADRVAVPANLGDNGYIVSAFQQNTGNGVAEVHIFYKPNGRYIRKKEVLINENANDGNRSYWPEGTSARDLLEEGLHFFTENESNHQAHSAFSVDFSRIVLEPFREGQPATLKMYSSRDKMRILQVRINMDLTIVDHEWLPIDSE